MSIIHDALKKAQEQRKQSTTGAPFTSGPPEVKKKPRIALIAVVAILAGAVAAYLYIPAFHRQKAPPVNQAKPAAPVPKVVAQAKPAQEPDKKEAAAQKEEGSPAEKTLPQKAETVKIPVPLKPAVPAAAKPQQTGVDSRERSQLKVSKKPKAGGNVPASR